MPADLTPSPWTKGWNPEVDLSTPAGEAIREVIRLLPLGAQITLFGSAPLQITLDPKFLSEDVDCFGPDDLKRLVEERGLGAAARKPYVQVCHDLNFKTSPQWATRAYSFSLEGRTVVLPHPIDILIGKLHRLEEKDLKAFKLVREKTGHPTEDEMISELQAAVDLFRPGFDEEKATDMKVTTRLLWREFFGREIDVAAEIIAPALQRRKEGYADDTAQRDYKAMLGKEAP